MLPHDLPEASDARVIQVRVGRGVGIFRPGLAVVVASAVALIAIVIGVAGGAAIGAVSVAPDQVWRALWIDDNSLARAIVWDVRLPRALVGALVGANLAVAGVLMQGVTRNPLASPSLIGATASGALVVVASQVLFRTVSPAMLPPLALLGALIGGTLSFSQAWRGGLSPVRLALAGVAVSALASAVTTMLLLLSGPGVDNIYFWLAGGLVSRSWIHVFQVLPWSIVGIGLALLVARQVNLLALGDEAAQAVGLAVHRWRLGLGAIALALTGASVAVAGPIAFVGLIIPHSVRGLVGPDNRVVIPVSALLGAALLIVADLGSRVIFAPREMPVGVLTVALGGPFFLSLIWRKWV